MKRCWINQPSKLQPFHEYHGMNVLVDYLPNRKVVTIYFLSGPVVSMVVDPYILSPGWR